MTKYHLIARATINIVGIWFLVRLLDIFYFCYGPSSSSVNIYPFIVFALFIGLLLLITFYILFYTDTWVEKITGFVGEKKPAVSDVWIAAFLRVGFFLCGLLIASSSMVFIVDVVSFLVRGPRIIINMIVYRYVDSIFYQSLGIYIFKFSRLLKAAFGIYLLFGAPSLVKLQIRRFKFYRSFGNAQVRNEAIT